MQCCTYNIVITANLNLFYFVHIICAFVDSKDNFGVSVCTCNATCMILKVRLVSQVYYNMCVYFGVVCIV